MEWLALIIPAVASITGAIINSISNKKTNETNQEIANQNIELQKETNAQNLEANATQFSTTVKDMQSVGMSPLAMSGLNGGGVAVAPQNDRQINPNNAIGDMFKDLGDKYQGYIDRKEQKRKFEKQYELDMEKLDLEKAKVEEQKRQYETSLAETIRHNKEQEKLGNYKNKIMNAVIDYIQNKYVNSQTGNLNESPSVVYDKIEEELKEEGLTDKQVDEAVSYLEKLTGVEIYHVDPKKEKKRIDKKAEEYKERYKTEKADQKNLNEAEIGRSISW